jgi:hypothetical protein
MGYCPVAVKRITTQEAWQKKRFSLKNVMIVPIYSLIACVEKGSSPGNSSFEQMPNKEVL